MLLAIEDNLVQGFTEQELRTELAIGLYQQQKVTLLQATKVAGVSLTEFALILRSRDIVVDYGYDETEFAKDIETMNRLFPQS
ncbi:UPF0175 family protein [Larkinella sp.]|uniref:UPF0175 family protein n=1 Tax=Larkinella sp. TaxID=2034517 RepID=UPI003BA977FA